MSHCFLKKLSTRSAPLALLLTILCTVGFSAFIQAEKVTILTAPGTMYADTQASFTITTLDSACREPVQRGVLAQLLSADQTPSVVLFGRTTDISGCRHIQFQAPTTWTGGHLLEAQIRGLDQSL